MNERIDVESAIQWWQRAVIYQVYPRSFADSNGDGVGDLAGITSHLDYLAWLGIDAIWISPIFPSPMADFGYDVANYVDVDPLFGSLADLDRLLAEAHARGIRVLLDFVPNHTSDQHPWFLESRSSRDSAHRDWYVWRDPRPGGSPPTNWLSNFGGPAWTWDEETQQYYYHAFLPQQPDLNWRNPEVRTALEGVLRFWLDRGVDGFRVDVIWQLVKDAEFRDNPPNPAYGPALAPHHRLVSLYNADRPEVHEVIRGLRAVLDEYPERVMLGEIDLPIERLMSYYGESGGGVHLPLNFLLLITPWDPARIDEAIRRYEAALPAYGWPNWVLSNHDTPRVATRSGDAQARVAAMLLLTLRGTPTVYYGDELGMRDVPVPPDRERDPFGLRLPGQGFGRDPQRTPMQWSTATNAGFSDVEPWLPLDTEYATRNVEVERDDGDSMLRLYRRLIELRRTPALAVGSLECLPQDGDVVSYIRRGADASFLVALNMGETDRQVTLPEGCHGGVVVISTHLDRQELVSTRFTLRANEGLLIEVTD